MKSLIFFNRKYLLSDFIIVAFIIVSPFLFFLYTVSPNDSFIWKTSLFTIESNVGNEIEDLLWILSYKLLTLILFIIWFVSCKHWWKFLLLITIFIEFHKFFSFLNEELLVFKFYNLAHTIVLFIPIFIVLIIITNRFHLYTNQQNLSNEINEEINNLMQNISNFRIHNYTDRKQRLLKLREDKENLSKRDYLKCLIQLREEFDIKIK